MDTQTLQQANVINRDLTILSTFQTSIQEIIADEGKTAGERLNLINTSYKLMHEGVTDVDTINALNVTIANFATAFDASITDSIDTLNTALTALCQP
jgi:hypothetical protein